MVGHVDAAQSDGHKQQPQPAADQKAHRPFDVDLSQGDQSRHQGCGAAHNHQHGLGQGAQLDQGFKPQQHPGAADHHHRIAQHRRRQGAFHGLIEPQVQGDLGAFAHGTGDQGQQNQLKARGQGLAVVGQIGRPALQAVKVPGACHRQQGDDTGQQHDVADALGQKGVAGPFDHQGLVVPGADDHVSADRQQFQQHIAEENGIGQHKTAQAGLKEAEGAKEPWPAPVHFEVADRKDLHQHMQAGDHRHGDQGRFADQTVKTDPQPSGMEPAPAEGRWCIDGCSPGRRIVVEAQQGQQAVTEGHGHHQEVDVPTGAGARALDQTGRPQQAEGCSQQRVQRDQPGSPNPGQGHGATAQAMSGECRKPRSGLGPAIQSLYRWLGQAFLIAIKKTHGLKAVGPASTELREAWAACFSRSDGDHR